MVELPHYPPLKSLHPDSSLNAGKLEKLERLSTEALLASLVPGLRDCLKTRPDGTILDGHHRITFCVSEAWMSSVFREILL